MRKNKSTNIIDEDKLIKEILIKRNSLIFLLSEDKVSDIYERNIEGLIDDNENYFLKGMIGYLSEAKMLTNNMRNRGYDMLSLLFFNNNYRNKERTALINQIKGLLNLMPIVDDYVFYKLEFDNFYDVTKLDYSEALEFNHETLFKLENNLVEFMYNLSCLPDEEYNNEYQLDDNSLYFINYALNNCRDIFQISAFRLRTFEILATAKYFLKKEKKQIEDFKEKYTINKKIIRKAKKV